MQGREIKCNPTNANFEWDFMRQHLELLPVTIIKHDRNLKKLNL